MAEQTRAHLVVTGRVQGVCFRLETQRAAARFNVTGWVRNKPDGTVEAIVEGAQTDVMSLIRWCQTGPSLSQVKTVVVTWQDYKGMYDDFGVRY